MSGFLQGLSGGIQTGFGIRNAQAANRRADNQAAQSSRLNQLKIDDYERQQGERDEIRGLQADRYRINQGQMPSMGIKGLQGQLQQNTVNQNAAAQQQSAQNTQALSEFGAERAMPEDLAKRQEGLSSLLNRMTSMRTRVDAGEQIDPTEMQEFSKYQIRVLNEAFPEMINEGTAGGQRKKLKDIVQLENGNFLLDIGVEGGEDTGRTSFATERRSSDPDDPLIQVQPEQMKEMIARAKTAIDARLIELGDTSPLAAQQAQQQMQGKRDFAQFESDLSQERADAQLGREKEVIDYRAGSQRETDRAKLQMQVKLKKVGATNVSTLPKGSAFTAFDPATGKNVFHYMTESGGMVNTGVEAGREPSTAVQKETISRLDSSEKLTGSIAKMDGLIDALQSGGMDGSAGKINIFRSVREFTGNKNSSDSIRAMVQGILNKEVIDSLPPGVASDRDISLAMSGQVSINSDPGVLAQALSGIKKAMVIQQRYDDFIANYLSNRGDTSGAHDAWKESQEEILADVYVDNTGQPTQTVAPEDFLNQLGY